jgi:hypothetical protein
MLERGVHAASMSESRQSTFLQSAFPFLSRSGLKPALRSLDTPARNLHFLAVKGTT